jgi:hypothetical protein
MSAATRTPRAETPDLRLVHEHLNDRKEQLR